MADEAVTLEFISRQLDRVTDRIGAVENKVTVLTGSALRVDGSIEGLAYMRASRVKKFFRDQHFFFSYVSRRLARAQFCIDGTAGPLLAALSRSTPGARRVAPEGARG